MSDQDYKKQEKYRLHVAADNINHYLDVLEEEGKERFTWAWDQIKKNVDALSMCFVDGTEEQKKICSAFIDSYKDVHDLWKKLDEKMEKKEEVLDEELQKAIDGYRRFLKDMSQKFGLGEFSE